MVSEAVLPFPKPYDLFVYEMYGVEGRTEARITQLTNTLGVNKMWSNCVSDVVENYN